MTLPIQPVAFSVSRSFGVICVRQTRPFFNRNWMLRDSRVSSDLRRGERVVNKRDREVNGESDGLGPGLHDAVVVFRAVKRCA